MARGIWKGTLGFGLVNIGVELFSGEVAKGLDLDMLDKRDHAPIGYKKYNKSTGEEVASDVIVKGYAVSKGQYVILSDEDLKSANPKATQNIDVIGFVEAEAIDLVYFDKPYIVGPLKGSERAYALFVKTLEDERQVGLAQVVIRTKQHLAAVYPYREALMVQLLRYDDEVRQPADVGITPESPARQALRAPEIAMARQLVESMRTEWKPEEFRDTYRDDIMRLIEARAAKPGKEGPVTAAGTAASEPRVLDLMAALKGSLAARAHERVVKRTPKVASSHKSAASEKAPAKKTTKTTKTATRTRKTG